jgi:hypothetical protein
MDHQTPPVDPDAAAASQADEREIRARPGAEATDLPLPTDSATRNMLANLAPAAGMRRLLQVDSLIVTAAVVVHVFSGGVAAAVVAKGGAEDWWLYLLMSLLTAVVLTNYGRLGARSTLGRRGFAGVFAIFIVVAWATLLADRVAPSWAVGGALGVGEARPELWLAVALEAVVVLLLVGHLVFVAPRARRQRKAQVAARLRSGTTVAGRSQAAWDEARASDAAASPPTGGAGDR